MEAEQKSEDQDYREFGRGIIIASIGWIGVIVVSLILSGVLDVVRLEFGNDGWKTMVLTMTLILFLVALAPSAFYELSKLIDNRRRIFPLRGLK